MTIFPPSLTLAIIPITTTLVLILLPSSSSSSSSSTSDTITQSHPLQDGSTIISKNGTFELGFFTPGGSATSDNKYLGIWYAKIPEKTVVWVANREKPITSSHNNTSTFLTIDSEANLVLLTQNKTIIWSSSTNNNASKSNSNLNSSATVVAQLLDTGNLILRNEQDQSGSERIWESFDYPSDTFLPGMKIGWDLKRGLNRRLTAWKRWDDPSPGDFSCGVVMGVVPELVMWRNGSQLYQRSPWNGVLLGGKNTSVFGLQFIVNQDEVVYTSQVQDKSVITRVVLNQTNYHRERYLLDPKTQTWNLYSTVPKDNCDSYNPCGPNGNCVATDSPRCHCLAGFDPKSVDSYNALDWAQGCVRTEGWICGVKNKDGFRKFSGLKVPDTAKSWGDSGMGIEDCRDKCWKNCSCTAYSNMYFGGGGSGCLLWFGDLLDLRVATVPGQDLYVRMAVSDTENKKKKMVVVVVVTIVVTILVLVMLLTYSCIRRRKRNIKLRDDTEKITTNNRDEGEQEDLELPYFDLPTIVQATNDFSSDNKLGQGGFGPVYKGTLGDGQEIAVKRLSQSSGQGLQEFKNEVIMCAKLQHRNLVKVLGCCIEGTEKMLVYEYMPNKSLDSVLFGCPQNKSLNWTQRFHVIFGIARGLLYLHQDSRLRIIHRDLKASNVLLDRELNPKISDFGMARMFRGDQIEGNTNRVVGTYGYMAPEYAVHGLFSTKSDVFSFGVLLLEIISGKKNRGASYPNYGFNLIGHAWKLWNEGNTKELVDSSLGDAFNLLEVLRCIHVSLLCMQQHPEDRPNMDLVLVMLSSECNLPQPKEPGFLIEKTSIEGEYSSNKQMMFSSSNEITMTLLQAR